MECVRLRNRKLRETECALLLATTPSDLPRSLSLVEGDSREKFSSASLSYFCLLFLFGFILLLVQQPRALSLGDWP
jgi:hypothetical protein